MSGDNLAIALFLWSLAALFFFEGRKDEGWRKRLLWGLAALSFIGGFGWPYTAALWPTGFVFVRSIAVSPVSWFVLFMGAVMLIAVSGRLKAVQQNQLTKGQMREFSNHVEATFAGITNSTEQIWAKINEQGKNVGAEIAALKKESRPPLDQILKKAAGVNWTPWKLMEKYQISTFSRILCGIDPNGAGNNETEAFVDVLKQDADSGKLKSNRRRDLYSNKYISTSWETEISKRDAIAWAKEKGLDVSYIE